MALLFADEDLSEQRTAHKRRKLWWALRLGIATGIFLAGVVGAGLVWRFFIRR